MSISVPITATASGVTAVVAGVPGRRVRVLAWFLSFGGAVTVQWRNSAGDNLTGPITGVTGGVAAGPEIPGTALGPQEHFASGPGQGVAINLSAAVAVGGYLIYDLVS